MSSGSSSPRPAGQIRVCIVAEHASFRFGGEASLPLHYFSRLRARGIEAWLVCHSRTRAEIDSLLPSDRDRIQYVPDLWIHKLIARWSARLPNRLSGATFGTMMVLMNQLIQRVMVTRLISSEGINIVHQPIPVSPRTPSFIYSLGVPVIIGPMNGGMDYPPAFRRDESVLTRATVAIGRASAAVVNVLIAGKKYASVLLVANERTRLALPKWRRGKIVEIPENGVDLSVWTTIPPQSAPITAHPRFVFLGRLVDVKRLDLVLRAVARLPDAELDVIGDGVMRAQWTALTEELGIADRVEWVGWLPQGECAHRLSGATALLLPSIRECGGAVVLEAMACGIPVIAVAWGGPLDYLDESCGILVPPSGPESIIGGFVEAARKLATDRSLRARLGAAGRQRVELHFDWNRKIDRILEIYRQAIVEFPRLTHANSRADPAV
jgi:glycosyltransferase involved in cell wall biosynthesis